MNYTNNLNPFHISELLSSPSCMNIIIFDESMIFDYFSEYFDKDFVNSAQYRKIDQQLQQLIVKKSNINTSVSAYTEFNKLLLN